VSGDSRRSTSRWSLRALPFRRRAAGRRTSRAAGLDTPLEIRRAVLPTPQVDPELFGRGSERFARFMGTAQFIAYMTAFVGIWLAWNTFGPTKWQFDPRSLNYTLLTLILSLQASYAAPLILLAQNRQADRDRVSFEQDRQRSERGLSDTEYLAREVAALRIALRDVATRDFLRSELRDLLEELLDNTEAGEDGEGGKPGKRGKGGKGSGKGAAKKTASKAVAAAPPQTERQGDPQTVPQAVPQADPDAAKSGNRPEPAPRA
jgi:uncharacterized membrane protein